MQMIEAVIKPHKLDAVKGALAKLGILGVTAVECKGFGRQMGHTERYRGAKLDVGFVPKVLLKLCVKSEDADKAVAALKKHFSTEKIDIQDGIRIDWPTAWVHARPSNTEPIMRVIAEAPDAAAAEDYLRRVRAVIDRSLA